MVLPSINLMITVHCSNYILKFNQFILTNLYKNKRSPHSVGINLGLNLITVSLNSKNKKIRD